MREATKMQTSEIVKKVGEVLEGKDKSNGDNSARVANMMRQLYPDGIVSDQYEEFLGMAKIQDKLFSATSQDGATKSKKAKSPTRDSPAATGGAGVHTPDGPGPIGS